MRKISLALLFFFSIIVNAQHITTLNGPIGGFPTEILIDSNRVFTGLSSFFVQDYSGCFSSTDAGENWINCSPDSSNEIYTFYKSGQNKIFAAYNKIFYTTDYGITWNKANGFSGSCWAISGTDENNLFAGDLTTLQLYKSSDGGNNWAATGLSGAALSLKYNKNLNIFLMGELSGLSYSTDKGSTWNKIPMFNKIPVTSIIYKDSLFYLTTGFESASGLGIYRSSDGINWSSCGLSNLKYIYSVQSDKSGNLYASAGYEGFYKSTDDGVTWNKKGAGLDSTLHLYKIAVDYNENIFLSSDYSGMYKSKDGGETFSLSGLPVSYSENLDINTNGDRIFASTTNGVQVYNKITGVWSRTGPSRIYSVSVSPSNKIFATTGSKIFSAALDSDNWEEISLSVDNSHSAYNVKAANDSLILLARNYLFVSENGGKDWRNTGKLTYEGTNIISANGKIYFNSYSNSKLVVYISDDKCKTFTLVETNLPLLENNALAVNNQNTILVCYNINGATGIVRSIYPYNNWESVSSDYARCLYIDSNNLIYAGSQNNLIVSGDNGSTWHTVSTFPKYIKAITGDGKGKLYVATSAAGVFSVDAATSVYEPIASEINFSLEQNYPNPFNPATVIRYSLPSASFVTLKVYNVLGKEVASLINEEKSAGEHSVNFDGSNLSSGVYFYSLKSGNYTATRKFVLIK